MWRSMALCSVWMSFKMITILTHSPNGSCSNSLNQIQCLVYILSEHSSSQTIVCLVGPVNELIKLSEPQYLLYRSKDLKKYVTCHITVESVWIKFCALPLHTECHPKTMCSVYLKCWSCLKSQSSNKQSNGGHLNFHHSLSTPGINSNTNALITVNISNYGEDLPMLTLRMEIRRI